MRLAVIISGLLLLSCSVPSGRVSAVTDGDTVKVRLANGVEHRVRLIGIDTPETVDPRKPVQCFGREASERMKELSLGKQAELVGKPDEDRDFYGRLLRYLIIDGEDIGARMIREGYAFSYKSFPHPRLEEYNALERQAEEQNAGFGEMRAIMKSSHEGRFFFAVFTDGISVGV